MWSKFISGMKVLPVMFCLLALPLGPVLTTHPQVMDPGVQLDGVWSVVNAPVSDTWNGIAMLSFSEGWIVGSKGTAFGGTPYGSTILRWDGINWSKTSDFYDPYELQSVAFLAPNEGWAVGGNWVNGSASMMLRWNGSSWSKSTGFSGFLHSVAPISADEVWAVGPFKPATSFESYGSVRLRWNGSIWNQVVLMDDRGLMSIVMLSDSDGWTVGWKGTIRHWNGTAWSSVSSPISTTTLMSVAALSANAGWAVGAEGVILRWDGNNWDQVNSPVTQTLNSVAMVSINDAWAVGEEGVILHWDGNLWSQIDSPVSQELNAITMLSANEGWAVGNGGAILHYRVTRDLFLPLVIR